MLIKPSLGYIQSRLVNVQFTPNTANMHINRSRVDILLMPQTILANTLAIRFYLNC